MGEQTDGRVLKKGFQVERHPCNIRGRLKGWKAREEGDALEGGVQSCGGTDIEGRALKKGVSGRKGEGEV